MNNINLGLGSSITPEQYNTLINTSTPSDVLQYYNELLANRKDDVQSQGEYTSSDYRNQLKELLAGYEQQKAELDDIEGQKGTWASSERQTRLNRLSNKYNRDLENAYNRAQYNLQNLYRNAEYNIGDVFGKQSLDRVGVNNIQSVTPTSSVLGNYQYNPFKFTGAQNMEKTAVMRNYANKTLSNLYQNPFKNF
ncbi:hypothetical protein EKK58_06180 [Candidatus Dependentiae bacterium]|nr:MAG: hypothetical protein EKK58_06180 [Candidatus Dependentiae bacterium]